MIRHPQGLGAGKRMAGLTQHVDLLSTILEFLDVAPPPGVEGHSLWPLVRGETDRIRTHAFSGRYPIALLSGQRGQATQVATFDGAAATDTDTTRLVEALTVTTEDWALISGPRGHPSELYHLGSDPAQEHNVLTEHPAVARDLHAALLGSSKASARPSHGSHPSAAMSPRAMPSGPRPRSPRTRPSSSPRTRKALPSPSGRRTPPGCWALLATVAPSVKRHSAPWHAPIPAHCSARPPSTTVERSGLTPARRRTGAAERSIR